MIKNSLILGFALTLVTAAPQAKAESNARASSKEPRQAPVQQQQPQPQRPANTSKATQVLNPQVTMVAFDPKEKGTRVNLQFSLLDEKGMPVNGLRPGRNGQFRVFFNGVEETSFETLTDASHLAPTVGITMVLDTSLSMQDQDALKPMRRAAERFVAQLSGSNQKFRFNYYQFATDVQRISNLGQINTDKAFGRFTSLYSALKIAIEQNPNDIILLFTDGADNKSIDNEQMRVQSIGDVETLIKNRQTIVHTVKLGVEDSNDLQGVPNKQVLQRLSVNGSVRYSEQPDEIVRAFEAIAAKIPSPYFFSYLCPRTSPGKYTLGIETDSDGVASDRGRWTTDVKFELPFEIGQPIPAVNPFTDSWYPILRPEINLQGQLTSTWSLAGFSPELGHPNGGQMTFLPSNRIGSIAAAFETVSVDATNQTARIKYSISGSEAEMRALTDLSNSTRDTIEIRITLMRTGFNGNYEWSTLIADSIKLGNRTLQGQQASAEGYYTVSLFQVKNFMANSLAITGEYIDSQGRLKVFSVKEQSLWRLP
jgi:hypothetical protein